MRSYEDKYNGGMGSNGLTSARHDVFHKYLAGERRPPLPTGSGGPVPSPRCAHNPLPYRPRHAAHCAQKSTPESFDPAVPKDLIYSGQKKLTDEARPGPALYLLPFLTLAISIEPSSDLCSIH